MSKKHRRLRQKKTFPWKLLIPGGALVLLAIFLLANRDGAGTPSVSVDQQRIDYGDVNFNAPRTFTIRVTNAGDGPLRFKEQPYIEVLEGC